MKILTPLLEHRGPLVEFAPVGELFWSLIGVGCGGVLSDMMVSDEMWWEILTGLFLKLLAMLGPDKLNV